MIHITVHAVRILLFAAALTVAAAQPAQSVIDDAVSSGIDYTGSWQHERNWPLAYASTVSYTDVPASTLTYRFNGDSITYVYNKAPNRGIASVVIDGVPKPELDLYSPTVRWRVAVTYSDLGPGSHTLEIRTTGRKDARSLGTFIDVDRLITNVVPALAGRTDDSASALSFIGPWARENSRWPAAAGNTLSYTNRYLPSPASPSAVTFTFRGESVTYFYTKAHNRGKAVITIDGVDREPIDMYAPPGQTEWQASTTFSDLGPGIHTLHISPAAEKNSLSSDFFIDVDQIRVGHPLHGLNFAPFADAQDPNRGAQVTEQQIRDRLSIVASDTVWIRSYGSSSGLENLARIARELGFKVAAGAWLGRDPAANEREIENLVRAMQAGHVDLAIVGNEVLDRGDLTVEQLVGFMRRVKRDAPGIPVTTAEVYTHLLKDQNRLVIEESSVVLANIHPYWSSVGVDAAVCWISNAYRALQRHAADKQVIIAEAGWPSCGEVRGSAVASPENAARFFLEFATWARTRGVPYLYFEALDQNWKSEYEGPQGACWGIRDTTGGLKPGFTDIFEGKSAALRACITVE